MVQLKAHPLFVFWILGGILGCSEPSNSDPSASIAGHGGVATTGGAHAGGVATGGVATGGVATGGVATGGHGDPSGGSAGAGVLAAGSASGGSAGTTVQAGNAGMHNAGTAGGGGVTGCRSSAECRARIAAASVSVNCSSPTSPGSTATAPTCLQINLQWCGLCSCPAQPALCVQNSECPTDRPFCAAVTSKKTPVSACSECEGDLDCPSARPHCIKDVGVPNVCRQCTSSSECAEGLCGATSHTCYDACQADSNCSDPSTYCTAGKRCDPRACATSADCFVGSTCQSGGCLHVACTQDAECNGGYCVNQICSAELGGCSYVYSPY
jgi:hypothetical protein